MTLAQTLFAVALGGVTLLVVGFAVYILSSTVWAGRWFGRRPKSSER